MLYMATLITSSPGAEQPTVRVEPIEADSFQEAWTGIAGMVAETTDVAQCFLVPTEPEDGPGQFGLRVAQFVQAAKDGVSGAV